MKKFQVFTPSQYVEQMLDEVGYQGEKILKKTFLENSVGEGNVLLVAVKRYIVVAKQKKYSDKEIKSDLEKYFVGFEVDEVVLNTCIDRLNRFVSEYGITGVEWGVRKEDYLKSSIEKQADYIVGNPPYITYQELKEVDRVYLKENFISCRKGKFDYCYAFIEKSLKDLSETGKLAYLIPNSIFKNVFAQNLRSLIIDNLIKIIDYKHTHIFEKVLTSSSIIIINNNVCEEKFKYIDVDFQKKFFVDKVLLKDKWYFLEEHIQPEPDNKETILFGELFKVANSVATLSNKVFVVPEETELEIEVIRPAASPRKSAKNITERIIFPYKYKNAELIRYSKEEFEVNFPKATSYLRRQKKTLDKRKSDGEWFEYGRSQGLKFMNQEKLMISSVITEKVHVYELDAQTIPYSGFYIIPIAEKTLDFAKEILESKEFYNYLEARAINASGKSIRISVNDVKNYPIKV